jgi:hypothetical protein
MDPQGQIKERRKRKAFQSGMDYFIKLKLIELKGGLQ